MTNQYLMGNLKRVSLTLLIAISFLHPSYGQDDSRQEVGFSISGKVIDNSTGEPLPFCNIYFSQSLKGVTSDVNGSFKMTDVFTGEYILVVSYVGYKAFQSKIVITDKSIENLVIKLNPDIQSLESIEVVGKRDKEWERKLKQLEQIILGRTSFSKRCRIKNPWVITFSGDKNNFTATASQSIEIENDALGFNVKLDLNRFQKLKEVFEFNGYFHFSQIQARSAADIEGWKENRIIAYNGSIPHFFRTVIDGNMIESGYTVESVHNASAGQKIKPDIRTNAEERLFFSKEPIRINYHHEFFEGEPQSSILVNRTNQPLRLTRHGIPKDPTSFAISGYLTREGVSTLLPLEYLRFEKEYFEEQVGFKKDIVTDFYNAFKSYKESDPEKLYVRTDKESYYVGETIWIRTYLMNAISNLPVNVSTLINLQLIDMSGEILLHQRLSSINGGVSSSIDLADTLSQGAYLIKAFTNKMQASDTSSFFQRTIQVSRFEENASTKRNNEEVLLKFYPEGGNLIEGVETTVAFQCNLTSFLGTLYEGEKEVMQITPAQNGMGSFKFKSNSGKRYFVRIDGVNNEFDLPNPIVEGATVSADVTSGGLDVQVKITDAYQKADLYLLVHNKGEMIFFRDINTSRSELTMDLTWEDLKPGLNHITLFDFAKRPLSERLIYKSHKKTPSIQIDLTRSEYSAREKVQLSVSSLLESADTLYTDLSVSVVDLDQACQAPGIRSYADLISDLTIQIPPLQGSILFEEAFKSAPDLYMLIYGWRRFTWQDFLANTYDSTLLSSPGIAIEGSVLKDNGKPYKEVSVDLFNRTTGSIYSATIKPTGDFIFKNLDIQTTDQLTLSLSNPNGRVVSPKLKIDSSETFGRYDWTHLLKHNPSENRNDQADQLALQRTLALNLEDIRLLNEVEITSPRLEIDLDPRKSALGKGTYSIKAEEAVGHESFQHIFDYIRSAPGVQVVRGHRGLNPLVQHVVIRGPKTINAGYYAQILVDNVPMSDDQVKVISPQDIESVEIFTGTRAAAYGARGAQGIVAFYTKRADLSRTTTSDQFIKSFTYRNSFYTPRSFEHPDYSTIKVDGNYEDLRSTLYWNPDISFTNFEKEQFSFYTSDRATDLLIDIQGITQNGKLIHERRVIAID